MIGDKKLHGAYLLVFLMVAIWSGINAYEIGLWWLEAGMCVLGLVILMATYKRFTFTNLTYTFILIHCIILLVGAHYSYAKVPLFDWIRDVCDQSRNNYDKVGHFAQGFIPAMIAREVIVRLDILKKKSWLPFFVICFALAISAFYELIEWWVAVLSESGAEDFLGTQGYEWDTQSDMLCALVGSITMLILFSKVQDKAIAKLASKKK